MKNIKDPTDSALFDTILDLFDEKTQEKLKNGFYGKMRNSILSMIPVETIAKHFSEKEGRPTKELYSICALMLMKDFNKWTVDQAIHNYTFDFAVRYALNLSERKTELSRASFFRYEKYFVDDKIGEAIFNYVTNKILEDLKIDITKQRLDSTHVDSNMAKLARRSLISRIILNFLKQLKRHYRDLHDHVNKELLDRYEGTRGWIFASTSEMLEDCDSKSYAVNQLGCDAKYLLNMFAGNEDIQKMTSYKNLLRVFEEQLELVNEQKDLEQVKKYKLKKNTGGKILVSPSDPDAEIGHKGPGYQAQISETLPQTENVTVIKNGVEKKKKIKKPSIVTMVIPQGGSSADITSIDEILKVQKENNVLPKELLADAGYNSSANILKAQKQGVELIGPCASNAKEDKDYGNLFEQCKFEGYTLTACPAGNKPISVRTSKRKNGTACSTAVFSENTCNNCPLKEKCLAIKDCHLYRIFYEKNALVNKQRREYQKTEEFKERYRARSGIEATFGRLKQFTTLKRLPSRGKKRVYSQIYTIFAMHNIMKWAKAQNYSCFSSFYRFFVFISAFLHQNCHFFTKMENYAA